MGAAVMVAAASARREMDRTLEAFRVADATAADRAKTMEQLGLADSPTIRRLLEAGVVVPGPAGNRVYLSEVAYAAYSRRTMRRVLVAAVIAIGMAIMGALFAFAAATRAGGRVP